MNNEKEISFGAFDSELMHQEIFIPEGFEATIDGDKIILTRKYSEDERIRKELIGYIVKEVGLYPGEDRKEHKWLRWLEKQEGCEHIRKDWLEHIKQSWYKEGFIDGKYSGGASKEWTINDSATLKEIIDFLENGTAKLQHDLTRYANWLKIQFTPIEKQSEQKQKPTNEDMVEALRTEYEKGRADAFAQMQEEWSEEYEEYNGADYGIDSLYHAQRILEKTLGSVDGYQTDDGILSHKCAITAVKKLYEQKPTEWSEEDEHRIKDTIYFLDTAKKHYASTVELDACIDWLKAIKDRYSWKPSSELDETSYQVGIKRVLENPESYGLTKYNWKPSDEQMEAVKRASNGSRAIAGNDYLIMESLYDDLKKLKGE